MIKIKFNPLVLTTTLAVLFLALTACKPNTSTSNTASSSTAGETILPGKGTEVEAVAGSGAVESIFISKIVYIGLEKLGYKTAKLQELTPPARHIAIANGDVDFTAYHWEKSQEPLFQASGGLENSQRIGVLSTGLLQGYKIDKKTADKYQITNIQQLQNPEIAKLFDSDGDGKANLLGCNTGWVCELIIENHLEAYGLKDTVEYDRGSYGALIVNAIARYERGESIFFYSWTPHWTSIILKEGEDTVWLEVPFTSYPPDAKQWTEQDTSFNGKNLGFAVDRLRIVVNNKFLAANPAAKRFFELVQIPVEDIVAQQNAVREGEDELADFDRHAREWVEKNQELFDSWIEEAKKVSY